MRRILVCFLLLLIASFAHAAEMVNVEYIHSAITGRWGITVPYNSALDNPHVAANMKYLLTAIDRANEILNGESITDYGNDAQYATLAAADTIAATNATAALVRIEPKFFITTTSDTASFKFNMSASGTFQIDWGDDTPPEIIIKDNTDVKTILHDYAAPGEYTIAIGGRATGYTIMGPAPINFLNNMNIAGIRGSLGAIFSTIGKGDNLTTQPRFYQTFSGCRNMKGEIPANLFTGIHGAPVPNMFLETFYRCTSLTGPIPAGLFADIKGPPASYMFHYTFLGCHKLTSIPGGLFAGISGPPAGHMFHSTFAGCTELRGGIPRDLFGDISGSGAVGMFVQTFEGCSNLIGPSAQIGDKYLYEIWPDATSAEVSKCYENTNFDDYDDIPDVWK